MRLSIVKTWTADMKELEQLLPDVARDSYPSHLGRVRIRQYMFHPWSRWPGILLM